MELITISCHVKKYKEPKLFIGQIGNVRIHKGKIVSASKHQSITPIKVKVLSWSKMQPDKCMGLRIYLDLVLEKI